MKQLTGLLTSDFIKQFDNKARLAEALRVNRSAISNWGILVPRGRAFEIEKITKGKLRVNLALYDKQPVAA